MLCEKCHPRELKAMRALESLTPSGSEFVNEVDRCVSFVRERMRSVVEWAKRDKEKRRALESIKNIASNSSADYDTPAMQKILQIVQEALNELA